MAREAGQNGPDDDGAPAWRAVLFGLVASLIAFVLVAIPGLAVAFAFRSAGASRQDLVEGLAVWGAVSMLAALALGGGVAAAVARRRDRRIRLRNGALSATATLILVGALVVWPLKERTDWRSVAIALEVIDAPDVGGREDAAFGRLVAARAMALEGVDQARALNHPTEAAHQAAIETAWYLGAALLAALAAGVLGGLAGRRSRSVDRPRAAALGTVATLAAVPTGLTLWLWPSIWAMYVAVFDTDQSAGPEIGISLTEVAGHPEVMWGETVTISARIKTIYGPYALLLGNDKPAISDEILVVGERALSDVGDLPADAALREGDVIRVTGVVVPADPAMLGVRAEETEREVAAGTPKVEIELESDDGEVELEFATPIETLPLDVYDGQAMLVARAIGQYVPTATEAGDKEFDAGSAGYDVGVTIDDILDDPDEYVGQTVTVSDEVEEALLTPHAFRLGDSKLLVISPESRKQLFVEATAYVRGEVRIFHLAEIEAEFGIDLPDEQLADHKGQPAIVAASVLLVT